MWDEKPFLTLRDNLEAISAVMKRTKTGRDMYFDQDST